MISSKDNKVRIIDFGLVINYMPDEKHRPIGRYSFQGTARFGSIHTLQGYNSGRRDDLEGLGYTIMELMDKEQLPWRYMESNKDIAQSKLSFLQSDFQDIPHNFLGIHQFIKACYNKGYDEAPNYDKLQDIIKRAFELIDLP